MACLLLVDGQPVAQEPRYPAPPCRGSRGTQIPRGGVVSVAAAAAGFGRLLLGRFRNARLGPDLALRVGFAAATSGRFLGGVDLLGGIGMTVHLDLLWLPSFYRRGSKDSITGIQILARLQCDDADGLAGPRQSRGSFDRDARSQKAWVERF